MNVTKMVADLIRSPTAADGLRTLTPADAADTRATPHSPRLRTVADSCGQLRTFP